MSGILRKCLFPYNIIFPSQTVTNFNDETLSKWNGLKQTLSYLSCYSCYGIETSGYPPSIADPYERAHWAAQPKESLDIVLAGRSVGPLDNTLIRHCCLKVVDEWSNWLFEREASGSAKIRAKIARSANRQISWHPAAALATAPPASRVCVTLPRGGASVRKDTNGLAPRLILWNINCYQFRYGRAPSNIMAMIFFEEDYVPSVATSWRPDANTKLQINRPYP